MINERHERGIEGEREGNEIEIERVGDIYRERARNKEGR